MERRTVKPGLRKHWKLAALYVPIWFQLGVALYWWVCPHSPVYDYARYDVQLPSGLVVHNPPEINLRPGEKLVIARHICSERPIDVQIDRSMDGPVYEEEAAVHRHFPAGCVQRMVVIDVDSESLPAGRYWYAASIDLHLNPIRQHFYVPLQGFWIDITGNQSAPPGSG